MNLSILDIEDINIYLHQHLNLPDDEVYVRAAIAGNGNMNAVLRVVTNKNNSFVVKKSFPYVHKYPHIAAPLERNELEAIFYQLLQTTESIQTFLPRVLYYDQQKRLLWLEDLGDALDYIYLYQRNQPLELATISKLINFLSILHHSQQTKLNVDINDNVGMKMLNYEYIFVNPFEANNGLNLDAITLGLGDIAKKYMEDAHLLIKIKYLGQLYLQVGKTLLHGDFYPCSWLSTAQGLKIIDFEFAFYGFAEFDLSVLYAHLILTNHDEGLFFEALHIYKNNENLNLNLIKAWAGVEIFRRIIGVAQLPMRVDLMVKKDLLDKAYSLVNKISL